MKGAHLYEENLNQSVCVAQASIKAPLNLRYSTIKPQKVLNYSQKWVK